MIRRFRIALAVLAVASMLLAPSAALARKVNRLDSQNTPPMVDVFIQRPLGLIMLGVSAVLFVPAAIFTGITRPSEMSTTYDYMLRQPVEFVFEDPIGGH